MRTTRADPLPALRRRSSEKWRTYAPDVLPTFVAEYAEVRRRAGVGMGQRTNELSVMYKPPAGGSRADYLALVGRDRPETP